MISLYLVVGIAVLFLILKLWQLIFGVDADYVNPFACDSRAPLKEKETDQEKRDEVLKQGFSESKVPSDLDAVVIGTGIGGMTCAAILAKAGRRVLLLEQHDQAGGCCHTFIEKGYEFDVGIHYIGEVNRASVTKTLLDQITEGQVVWADLAPDFDDVVFLDGESPRTYQVLTGEQKWKNYLKDKFPEEKENIDRIFGLMKKALHGNMRSTLVKFVPLWLVRLLDLTGLLDFMFPVYKYNRKTVKDVVWRNIKNADLRDIMSYNFGDYGVIPSRAGFSLQALLLNHFMKGASYPVGGASEIAHSIIPVIEASGGKVLVRAEVVKILLENGRACGVEVRKGTSTHKIYSKMVISAAGVENTLTKFLPAEVSQGMALNSVLQRAFPATGTFSVFVGLDCPSDALEIPAKKNVWIYPHNDMDAAMTKYWNLSVDEALDAEVPLCFLSFPSTKDPEWEKRFPAKTTMAIVTFMPYEWFEKWADKRVMKRGDDYEYIKKAFADKMIQVCTRLYPSIEDHIDYVNVGSPLSHEYYIATSKGSAYGMDHGQWRFSAESFSSLRPKTEIPGLYMTGQDIMSCGFVGGLWSGMLSSMAILGTRVMQDFIKLHKKIKSDTLMKKGA